MFYTHTLFFLLFSLFLSFVLPNVIIFLHAKYSPLSGQYLCANFCTRTCKYILETVMVLTIRRCVSVKKYEILRKRRNKWKIKITDIVSPSLCANDLDDFFFLLFLAWLSCLPAWLSDFMPVRRLASLAWLPACLHVCLSACLPACVFVCLPACLSACTDTKQYRSIGD